MTYDNIDHSKNSKTDQKPWWVISFIICGFLLMIVFALYYLHHNREYLKKVLVENDYIQGNHHKHGKSIR